MSDPVSTEVPANVLKKLEKGINKEATADEKSLKHAVKDLQSTEKAAAKMKKAAEKAEGTLHKSEKKEVGTSRVLSKADRNHDIAVADVKSAEADARTKKAQELRLQRELKDKKAHVEAITMQKKANDKEREENLKHLKTERRASQS